MIGNFIAAMVIESGNQSLYFIVMSAISFVGSLSFLLLRKPINVVKNLAMEEESTLIGIENN